MIVALSEKDWEKTLTGFIPVAPRWSFVCCAYAEERIVVQDRLNQALLGSGWVYDASEHTLIQKALFA